MSVQAPMPELRRKRGNQKAKVTNLSKFIDKYANLTAAARIDMFDELGVRFDDIDDVLRQFNSVQNELECKADDESLPAEYEERYLFEEQFYSSKAEFKKYIRHNETRDTVNGSSSIPSNTSISSTNNNFSKNHIKLPTLELPKFDGAYTEWIEFKNSFSSLINSNASLDEIQKFHYLRASLKGDAAQIISAIEFPLDNYIIAWNLLCERYDNDHLLVFNHLKSIFDIVHITKATSILLRHVIDNVQKHLRALEALDLPTQHWDIILIYILSNRLDKETLKGWEERRSSRSLPTFNEFITYLKGRADLLETVELREPKVGKNRAHSYLGTVSSNCVFCRDSHPTYRCPKFINLPVAARWKEARSHRLCFNCLQHGHFPPASNYKADEYYVAAKPDAAPKQSTAAVRPAVSAVTTLTSYASSSHVTHSLLATVQLNISDKVGNFHTCRAVLDSGSQTHFISESLVKKLKLHTDNANLSVTGINQTISKIRSKCEVKIKSTALNYTRTICCFVIPQIASNLPHHTFDKNVINLPSNITLADPNFDTSSEVDMLLGAPLFWDILQEGRISLGKNKPVLQNTTLGWVIAGFIILPKSPSEIHCYFIRGTTIHEQLKNFWEVEDNCLENSQLLKHDSNLNVSMSNIDECEQQFCQSVKRDDEGRFIVNIPFKQSTDQLGDSRLNAIQRFRSVEKTRQHDINLYKQYRQFINEYKTMGHMTRVESDADGNSYFLPHHGVVKQESLTTKLRVVFDASCPTSSGYSLNDIQYVGPTLHQELLTILLRFRQHKIVVTADIAKMYRQILITPEHRRFQQIFWRNDRKDELSIFQLNTVTYGLTSSPYLAIRCLHRLAEENLHLLPKAAKTIIQDMYVDDLITGGDTIEETIELCNDVSKILASGSFELRKWASNSLQVLKSINVQEQDLISHFQHTNDTEIKTLGVQWNSTHDTLTYYVNFRLNETYTKRTILSNISKIYDPLGLLAPCIIVTKMIIQQLWILQLSWDEEFPNNLKTKWASFRDSLSNLNKIKIPRHVCDPDSLKLELHGFCDASNKAYAACIYVKSIVNGNITNVRLLCAKTRVAPVKTLTIPRLELCGAVLLAKLMQKVMSSMSLDAQSYYWTDSQVVLCWLRLSSKQLQPFVSNRVTTIRQPSNARSDIMWRKP